MTKTTQPPRRTGEVLGALPPVWPHDLSGAVRTAALSQGRKVVVLDDDPTGTQTVYDIPVVTEWSVDALRAELAGESSAFYILTNSRSLTTAEAASLNRTIARNLLAAAALAWPEGDGAGRISVVSRSDSTLRGHFPAETAILAETLGPFDATLLVPFFEDGGRYTIDDVHYVDQDGYLVPAAETPFARDAAFGYRSSNLREWVAEKTRGLVAAAEVESISIDELRRGGPTVVCRRLLDLPRGSVCVVNAAADRDLAVFALGLLEAEAAGRRFLARTAASFVAARLGLPRRLLLSAAEVGSVDELGGLTVVGSYVPKTTTQLERLLAEPHVVAVELDVPSLLDASRRESLVADAAARINQLLSQRRDVVLFTSRGLVWDADSARSLKIGRQVSDGVIDVVRRLERRPRYLIAKGGITSSEVATRGLGVRRAIVLGQLLPGVPVWRLGAESRYPGLGYVVFPGNVGGPSALADAVASLTRRK